ncbi:MAG: hypothetical protein HQ582_16655, partial [Planctomycetes bacterium]|nr:hypothetical protein [Planctomycetota bacterium]
LEVTEVEPEDSEADLEAREVDLDVGGFDLNVDEAAPELAESGIEATEFNPEIDGFRPEQDPPETDLRKTVSGKETLIIPEGLLEAEPGPEPLDIPPAAAPADEQSPDFSAWGTGDDDAGAPEGDQVPEPPGAGQPPEIAPRGTDRATVQWEPGMDEETVDDEPDEEEPPNEDLDDFLKGFE